MVPILSILSSLFPRRMRVGAALVFLPLAAVAQHSHLNAGAFSPAQDAQLYFVNGANFVTNSGYVLNLAQATNGQYSGYFHGSITLTALPATVNNGGPAFGHAAPGAFLEAQVESVLGPADGQFGFWEELDAAPRFSIPAGTTNSLERFPLSEADGTPGSDPAGHIHGRRFTVTTPGLYTVGFRLQDTTINGSSRGPIHRPSERFPIHMQAGLTVAWLEHDTNGVVITFATKAGRSYFVETTDDPAATSTWQTLTGPLAGNDRLQRVHDPSPMVARRFYRLRATVP